jgi:hypothetical protein
MRYVLPLVLAAASVSAQTFTNNLGSSDPSFVEVDDGFGAWDPSVAFSMSGPPNQLSKPWDVSTTDGTYSVSGWTSLPSSYIANYPITGNFGYQPFEATLGFTGLSTFRLSEVGQISYQITANAGNTAPLYMMVFLYSANGKNYQLHGQNSTLVTTRTGPGDTGDFIFTYTNIIASDDGQDPSNTPFTSSDTFSKILFLSSANFNIQTYRPYPDQFLDVTFQSVSIAVTPVPEASTYGLALGGLALVGAVIRRRSKRA